MDADLLENNDGSDRIRSRMYTNGALCCQHLSREDRSASAGFLVLVDGSSMADNFLS